MSEDFWRLKDAQADPSVGPGMSADAPIHFPYGSNARPPRNPGDRCDKCGLHIREWDEKPHCEGASITQSPRHSITRFHIPVPKDGEG